MSQIKVEYSKWNKVHSFELVSENPNDFEDMIDKELGKRDVHRIVHDVTVIRIYDTFIQKIIKFFKMK